MKEYKVRIVRPGGFFSDHKHQQKPEQSFGANAQAKGQPKIGMLCQHGELVVRWLWPRKEKGKRPNWFENCTPT